MPEPYPSTAARTRARLISLLGMSLVTAAFVAACVLYWRKIPDPVTDFGREIYVPWRIQTAGEAPYRDIAWINGPLSVYVHAGVFWAVRPLGGANLQNLKLFNAIIAGLVAILIYRLVRAATSGDDLCATIAGVGYAAMFAVQQYRGANYNFLTPYSYELPHGIALSLVMIACLWRASRSRARQVAWLSIAGVMLGLVFLTKPEVFIAALIGAIAGQICLARGRATMTRDRVEIFGIFSGYAVATVVLAVLLLTVTMSPGDAIGGIVGAYRGLANPRVTGLHYYAWVLGTDRLDQNVQELAVMLAAYAVLFAAPAALGWLLGRLGGPSDFADDARWTAWRRRGVSYVTVAAAVVLAGLVAGALALFWPVLPWPRALKPLPVVMLVCAALLVQMVLNRPKPAATSFVLPAAFVAFAAALLAKMALNVHAYHYGFALAMPAFVVLVMATVAWLPQGVAAATGSLAAAWVPRLTAIIVILMCVAAHAYAGYVQAMHRTASVGIHDDQFFGEPGGYAPLVDEIFRDLRSQTTKTQTVAAIPDGAMINFLARRANPTGHLVLMPPEVAMFGEDRILDDFRRMPPDFIAIVGGDMSIYGVGSFGEGYARKIAEWVRQEYEPMKRYGALPYQETGPGILLMKRKGVTTTTAPTTAPGETE